MTVESSPTTVRFKATSSDIPEFGSCNCVDRNGPHNSRYPSCVYVFASCGVTSRAVGSRDTAIPFEIVEFVQRGDRRAGYCERVLDVLSEHLNKRIGRGYSTTNPRYFRTFYLVYRERNPEIRPIGGGELGRADPGAALEIRHKRGGVSGARRFVHSFTSALALPHL